MTHYPYSYWRGGAKDGGTPRIPGFTSKLVLWNPEALG